MRPNSQREDSTHTVIPIAIAQMVMYSIRLTLCLVSQTASISRSIPSTKMRAPTTATAEQRLQHATERQTKGLTQVSDHTGTDHHDQACTDGQHDARQSRTTSNSIKQDGIDVCEVVWDLQRVNICGLHCMIVNSLYPSFQPRGWKIHERSTPCPA